MTQKIIPHLWFDKEAGQAAEFYTSIFPSSKILHRALLHDTPSGTCEVLSFSLNGYQFAAISAGPLFKLNPSISFFVNFDPSKDPRAKENLDLLWKKLSEGGTPLMELDQYPFSERYGWIQDRFGVSWQLILTNPKGEERPFIAPSLLFVGAVSGRAEEAIDYYVSVFKDSARGLTARYGKNQEPDREGTLMFADFKIEGQWFAAMDSAHEHQFGFNEAVSLMIPCETQQEIDAYWKKLSHVPEAEQCGWVKDKFGVSWQITPARMQELLSDPDPKKVARVTQAFLKMKKFDLATLEKAAKG